MSLEVKRLRRRRFSVDDYHRLVEVGILEEDERVELIGGQIFEMAPIGARHNHCLMFLTEVLVRRLEGRAVVSPQNSLRLGRWSEPQPDFAVLRPPMRRYAEVIPTPEDAFLVIEVADTTQYRHRVVKLPRYAAAGVAEVWIVDVPAEAIEVYREPAGRAYRQVRRAGRGESVAPAAFPDLVVAVGDVLG